MLRFICKSKIHRGKVTRANLQYMGSITIDKKLLEAADILPGEKVQIVNLNNGSRVETYCMPGRAGSGIICMNGAAARWAQKGDEVIIISYGLVETEEAKRIRSTVVFVDEKNRIRKVIKPLEKIQQEDNRQNWRKRLLKGLEKPLSIKGTMDILGLNEKQVRTRIDILRREGYNIIRVGPCTFQLK